MSRGPDESDEKGEEEKNAKEEVKEKVEEEEEWTMDSLLGFGRFHHFQIWVVQSVVAILGKLALRPRILGTPAGIYCIIYIIQYLYIPIDHYRC